MRKIRSHLVIICFLSIIGLFSNCFYYPHESQFSNKDSFPRSNILLNSSAASSWSRILEVNTVGDKIIADSSNNVYILGRFYYHPDEPIFNIKL